MENLTFLEADILVSELLYVVYNTMLSLVWSSE